MAAIGSFYQATYQSLQKTTCSQIANWRCWNGYLPFIGNSNHKNLSEDDIHTLSQIIDDIHVRIASLQETIFGDMCIHTTMLFSQRLFSLNSTCNRCSSFLCSILELGGKLILLSVFACSVTLQSIILIFLMYIYYSFPLPLCKTVY